ncbi:MAG: hypothetical protein GXO82_03805 [Chlorobi bacterium]|nr:hypothetical protein [Chlorobiota bacterium]
MRAFSCFTLAILSLVAGCTENPFGGDDTIESGNSSIRGSIVLSDRGPAEGIHVWLDGFDIKSRTDAKGEFTVTIPPPSGQDTPGGATGVFTLYGFLANYSLFTATVATRNGYFLYGTKDISTDGSLAFPGFMIERFSMNIDVSPNVLYASVLADSGGVVDVTVTLTGKQTGVRVYFPTLVDNTQGPLFFHNLTTGEVFILESAVAQNTGGETMTLGVTPATRIMKAAIGKHILTPGTYEIRPYLRALRPDVPRELIRSLGARATSLHADYMNYPLKFTGGRLTVQP